MYLKLALRNLFRNGARTAITLLVIGSGSTAMIIAAGFIHDTVTQIREAQIRDQLGHLRIYKHGYLQDGLLHPFDYLIMDTASLSQDIMSLPEVTTVGPRLSYYGLVGNDEITLPFIMDSFDDALSHRINHASALIKGQFASPDKPFEVSIGEGLAKGLNLNVGSSAVLLGNTQHGAMNAADVTVSGVFRTISKDFDDHGIRAPIGLAQRLLRVDGAQMLVVFLDHTEATDRVRQTLQKRFQSKGLNYDIQAWYEMPESAFVKTTENVYRSIYRIIRIILALLIILSIANTMNMAVLERLGEIGTLMAIGTQRRGILKLFLAEGFLLGVAGGVAGCLVGIVLAIILSSIGIPMPNPPGTTASWVAHITLTSDSLLSAFLMALVTSIISSVLPAIKASHIEVAEALRHNI